MADIQVLNNGETYGTHRGKLNLNFASLNAAKLEGPQVLTKVNATPYTPTEPYHPAPKLYVDNLWTNFHSTYNPQSISGDIFARSNHTGTQTPATIATDASNRFVSDVEKATWNGKEPGIGAKGTAFNKSFGTVAGSVAEGNHTHTKVDLGLGNVDNTADTAKPVSTAQQTQLDLKLPINGETDYIDFDNDNPSNPAWFKGRVFYCPSQDTLAYYNGNSNVKVNIGQEVLGRVHNATGGVLTHGDVVRFNNTVDPTTGLPRVDLALADDFDTSRVVGVVTSDIANNGTGYVTALGVVHDVDTSAFTAGQLLYLSDTVPGGLTPTPPAIVTIVCAAIKIGVTDGTLYVKPDSNIALPNTFGELDGKSATLDVTTAYQNITGYTTSDGLGDIPNTTNGTIEALKSSKYELTINFTGTFASSASGTRELTLQIWNNTQSTQIGLSTISIPKDSGSASRSFSKLATLTEGDEVVLRIRSGTTWTSQTITFADMSMYAISL